MPVERGAVCKAVQLSIPHLHHSSSYIWTLSPALKTITDSGTWRPPLRPLFIINCLIWESYLMYLSQCLNISQWKDLELNGFNVNNIDCWALWSLLERASTIIHDLKGVWDHGAQGHYNTACPEPLLLAHNLKLLWEVNLCKHAGKSSASQHPADQEKSHGVSYPTGELWGCLRHLNLVKLM
jgi:hypothetical protein